MQMPRERRQLSPEARKKLWELKRRLLAAVSEIERSLTEDRFRDGYPPFASQIDIEIGSEGSWQADPAGIRFTE
jgi:hypothetical protein